MEINKKIIEFIIDEVIIFHDSNNIISKKMKEDFINNTMAKVNQVEAPVKPACGDCENYSEYDNGIKYCSNCGSKLNSKSV